MKSGRMSSVAAVGSYEDLDRGFNISEAAEIPVGRYHFQTARISSATPTGALARTTVALEGDRSSTAGKTRRASRRPTRFGASGAAASHVQLRLERRTSDGVADADAAFVCEGVTGRSDPRSRFPATSRTPALGLGAWWGAVYRKGRLAIQKTTLTSSRRSARTRRRSRRNGHLARPLKSREGAPSDVQRSLRDRRSVQIAGSSSPRAQIEKPRRRYSSTRSRRGEKLRASSSQIHSNVPPTAK